MSCAACSRETKRKAEPAKKRRKNLVFHFCFRLPFVPPFLHLWPVRSHLKTCQNLFEHLWINWNGLIWLQINAALCLTESDSTHNYFACGQAAHSLGDQSWQNNWNKFLAIEFRCQKQLIFLKNTKVAFRFISSNTVKCNKRTWICVVWKIILVNSSAPYYLFIGCASNQVDKVFLMQ